MTQKIVVEGNIKVTDRADLKQLMALEFHDDGGSFVVTEPENYIKRLTEKQKELLTSKKAKTKKLTAFIVFGDGFIDRAIGGIWLGKDKPIVRPNSSLALFYKDENGKVELVFYTRFFQIFYLWNKEARKLCKELDDKKDLVERSKIKKKLFNEIKNYFNVKGLPSVTDMPSEKVRYYFAITSHKGELIEEVSGWCMPYLRLLDSNGKDAPCIIKKNTIHGTLFTKGCWMLLRNFLWDWPKNEDEEKYINVMKCFQMKRLGKPEEDVRKCFENAFGLASISPKFISNHINYAYYDFLHKFSGIQFNHHENGIKIPDYLQSGPNCWIESQPPAWGPNVFGKPFGLGKRWADVFIFKRSDHFTPDPGDTEPFK